MTALLNCSLIFFFITCLLQLPGATAWIRKKSEARTGPKTGDVKLVDGNTNTEGTVVIFRSYDWGTICDDEWDINEARVVCNQLGHGEPRDVFHRNFFNTRGFTTMLLDDLQCFGNESSLTECNHYFPFGQHDCHPYDELAGVRCYDRPMKVQKYPDWNPLGVEHPSTREIKRMQSRTFNVTSVPHWNDTFGNFVVAKVGNVNGGMCPDDFTLVEGNVFCREIGLGFAKDLFLMSSNSTAFERKYTIRTGLCYGNETGLDQCKTYTSSRGVPCVSDKYAVVRCTNKLPDLLPDLRELQQSAYLSEMPMWTLRCAMEENCLSRTAYSAVERMSEGEWGHIDRFLLRFSSIIANEGTDDFVPLDPIEQWEWHGCHEHYHSMKFFARYEIVNDKKYIMTAGHKASFCLEDNECRDPDARKYRCSRHEHNRGTQGISPGCKDIYLHNFDCQWIDITDLPRGRYQFRIIVNPEFKVSELNYFNNAIVCNMYHMTSSAFLRNCKYMHPHDL